MRTKLTLVVIVLAAISACTVKRTDVPEVAGPSTFAKDLNLTATPDIITQNGVDQAQVRVAAKGPNGAPVAGLALRAEIRVNGIVQDFGSLSSKVRATDSDGTAVFVYTAPPLPLPGVVGVAQTVQIAVTPLGTDFGTELSRIVDIHLIPQGTIGPSNPTLVAAFTITPNPPTAFNTASFDATTSTNQGSPCGLSCSYTWDFGDNTGGSGIQTTHQYRTAGAKVVRLIVTDSVGAQATAIQNIVVNPSPPPTAVFTVSPTGSVGVGQDVFFDASTSRPAAGRTITGYSWSFGDQTSGSGVTVSHRYSQTGSYQVVLTVTDDAGSQTQSAATTVTVIQGNPTASLVLVPSPPLKNVPAIMDASGSTAATGSFIVDYTFSFGDGSPAETTNVSTTTHTWAPGTYAVSVTVRDSLGRTGIKTLSFTVAP